MAEVMICKHRALGRTLVIQWQCRVGVWCVGSMELIQLQAQKTCAPKQGLCELLIQVAVQTQRDSTSVNCHLEDC